MNVADDIKEQFLPLYTYNVDVWYLLTRLTYGIGAYASKAGDLQEFARMNLTGDNECILEDVFYNKENGFTVSEILHIIAITAYQCFMCLPIENKCTDVRKVMTDPDLSMVICKEYIDLLLRDYLGISQHQFFIFWN